MKKRLLAVLVAAVTAVAVPAEPTPLRPRKQAMQVQMRLQPAT